MVPVNLSTIGPIWLYHPLMGRGYQFWSGIGSDFSEITTPVAIVVGMVTAWLTIRKFLHTHFECHVDGCSRLGFHELEHHRVCWQHHPQLKDHEPFKVPWEHILAEHGSTSIE